MAAAAGMPKIRRHGPLIAIGVLFALFVVIAACSSKERTIAERGNALDRQLICPICPGETIDQAQVQIAKDMRKIVREKLANGEDEAEIKDFFVARYGVSVLASPPASGFNLLIWIVPPVGLAGALGALYLILREMRRRGPVPAIAGGDAAMDTANETLAPYREAVDREMRQSEAVPDPENDTLSSQNPRELISRSEPDDEGGGGINP